MSTKASQKRNIDRWVELADKLLETVPQVAAICSKEEDFISLHIKLTADGTMLGVLKQYGSSGEPLVCFGSGYGVSGALLGLEGSVAANKWRTDKPFGKSAK